MALSEDCTCLKLREREAISSELVVSQQCFPPPHLSGRSTHAQFSLPTHEEVFLCVCYPVQQYILRLRGDQLEKQEIWPDARIKVEHYWCEE